ncbi:MAG: AI-2E family transporter [Spirochaetaceae bacterium]|nr:MAG: AI-2E family transporter [Spirochaetaceae bacterium]
MNEQPRIRILEISFLAMLIALTYGFYLVMEPFVLNAFLAAIFTSVLFPFYERLRHRFGDRPNIASITVVMIAFIAVAIPLVVIGILVYSEAVGGYQSLMEMLPDLEERFSDVSPLEWAEGLPVIGPYIPDLRDVDLFDMIQEVISNGSGMILTLTQRGLVTFGGALVNSLVILLLMFFFFASGRRLMAAIYRMVPLPNHELMEIAKETRQTTVATLVSTIIIGLMEGTLGVVLFLVFGLPSPFLWGMIIVVVSMIPLIGTNLVIVPAGIALIVGGRVWAGLLMIAAGVAGVAATQNVVRPKLLGDRTGLHPAIALLSTIGGIAWLGVIGFLVGPLLASLFLVVWRQFALRYRDEYAARDRDG